VCAMMSRRHGQGRAAKRGDQSRWGEAGLDEDAEGHRPEDLVLLLGKCSGFIECILPHQPRVGVTAVARFLLIAIERKHRPANFAS